MGLTAASAYIMMSKSPIIEPLTITANGTYTASDGIDGYSPINVVVPTSSGGGIWDVLDAGKIEPLATIALAPNTVAYVYDTGKYLSGQINKDLDGDTVYLQSIGYYHNITLAIAYNNKYVFCYDYGNNGALCCDQYLSTGYHSFNRQGKIGALNVKSYSINRNGNTAQFRCLIQYYDDYLNFQQAEYEDGSHWEEQYAWYSGMFSTNFSCSFYEYPDFGYNRYVRGDTIEEKYDNWTNICNDVINHPNDFPILNYTKSEDHFSSSYYTNDVAISRGYYDGNVAYMDKWGKPELWA